MTVSRLEEISKKRIKVYIEEEFAFVLYAQDIRTYHISEGCSLGREDLEQIYQETVLRRAKQKAMQLLMRSDYSEYGLRQRLKNAFYPERAIDDTIAFLYSYHYLDDARYTEHYMISKGNSCSYTELRQRLLRQGIDSSMIHSIYEKLNLEDEDVLSLQMQKKLAGRQELTVQEKNRIIAYFLRRGFSYHSVETCLAKLLSVSE